MKKSERESQIKLFTGANQIIDEFSILIVPGVQKLIEAAHKEN